MEGRGYNPKYRHKEGKGEERNEKHRTHARAHTHTHHTHPEIEACTSYNKRRTREHKGGGAKGRRIQQPQHTRETKKVHIRGGGEGRELAEKNTCTPVATNADAHIHQMHLRREGESAQPRRTHPCHIELLTHIQTHAHRQRRPGKKKMESRNDVEKTRCTYVRMCAADAWTHMSYRESKMDSSLTFTLRCYAMCLGRCIFFFVSRLRIYWGRGMRPHLLLPLNVERSSYLFNLCLATCLHSSLSAWLLLTAPKHRCLPNRTRRGREMRRQP